ncbi:MAG: indole-3-glycerol phosphate synthase TrpC [Alphaproteobacteria bacterium]|nr:indole-3-glycerol phosphate synthase TrpC [Alphaproteobacteria bacterium]
MSDILARIVTDKRSHVAACKGARSLANLTVDAKAMGPPRGFAAALAATVAAGGFGLIAEIKRASPSHGLIRADFDPAALARAYAQGGATCLSILTDRPYFQGDDCFVADAKAACPLPVLRKDFMIDPYQIVESRAIGADCVLLILSSLDDALARDLAAAAREHGLDILVEVHDEAELERALALPGDLIGVNNRDLKTLTVDLATSERLAARAPKDRALVAESGLRGHGDLRRMAKAGIMRFLVGESLMRQADVATATALLLGA